MVYNNGGLKSINWSFSRSFGYGCGEILFHAPVLLYKYLLASVFDWCGLSVNTARSGDSWA